MNMQMRGGNMQPAICVNLSGLSIFGMHAAVFSLMRGGVFFHPRDEDLPVGSPGVGKRHLVPGSTGTVIPKMP
jgi:hypothetical protein